MSLYTDELRPYSRILKKRLAEHGFKITEAKEIDTGRLRVLCEDKASLNVKSEEGGEWS